MNTLIVVVLVIVIAVMALWIKELIYHKKSDQNIIGYLHGENTRKESALFEIKKLLDTEAGGLFRRISGSTEILEYLNEYDSEVLSETIVFSLLDKNHQFLLALVYLTKKIGLESPSDFEAFSDYHGIDNIKIFERVGEKLEQQPFVIERLSQLKKEEDKMNENN